MDIKTQLFGLEMFIKGSNNKDALIYFSNGVSYIQEIEKKNQELENIIKELESKSTESQPKTS